MRKACLVILSCLVLGYGLEPPGAASEVTALEILDKSFDPQAQQLGYELWNESDKIITAWRLSLARSDSHGHAQRSILDQDFFDRRPSMELGSKRGPVAPGASVTAQWYLDLGAEDLGPTALSLKVSAVVFDDLTWEGEPDVAAAILEARTVRVAEIGKVVAELERRAGQPWSSQEWSAALKKKAQLLKRQGNASSDATVAGRRETAAVLSATQRELAQWLEDASREIALSPSPDEAIGHLADSLRQRYETGLRATPGGGQSGISGGSEKGGER